LVVFPSSSLLPMTATNCKNLWSWRVISPSLAFSTSCQSSSQITAPVHSPFVNSPSIYLPHPHTVFIYLAPLHPNISTCTFIFCTSTIPLFHFYIVITSPPWPIYCLNSLILPHLHSLYIDLFSFVLLYYWLCFVYSMCNCVVVCVELLCFILARSQLQMRTCSQLVY
jgi:hypothetical protein